MDWLYELAADNLVTSLSYKRMGVKISYGSQLIGFRQVVFYALDSFFYERNFGQSLLNAVVNRRRKNAIGVKQKVSTTSMIGVHE
jgi:hypothetical protein